MAIQTRLGQIGFGHRPYAGFVAKAADGATHTAIGPGWIAGAWINQLTVEVSWIAGAWGTSLVVRAKQRIRGFTRNIGRLMNP